MELLSCLVAPICAQDASTMHKNRVPGTDTKRVVGAFQESIHLFSIFPPRVDKGYEACEITIALSGLFIKRGSSGLFSNAAIRTANQ